MPGKVYTSSREIQLIAGNSNLRIDGGSYKAIPGTWETNGITINGSLVNADDFFFRSQVDGAKNATYVDFIGLKINCNNLCGGIKASDRNWIFNCRVEKVAGIGYQGAGSDVRVIHSLGGQWTTQDVEYYDPSKYTGIIFYASETDMRIDHCTGRWAKEIIHISKTNTTVSNCHFFNGMQGYNYTDRNNTMNAALDNYFGTNNAATTNYAPRTDHVGLYHDAPITARNSLDNVYWDNCVHRLKTDGVIFSNNKFGSKKTSSLRTAEADWTTSTTYNYSNPVVVRNPDDGKVYRLLVSHASSVFSTDLSFGYWEELINPIDMWIDNQASTVGTENRLLVHNFTLFVGSAPRKIVKWTEANGNTWSTGITTLNDDVDNIASGSDTGQNWSMGINHTMCNPNNNTAAITFVTAGNNSKLRFRDVGTSGIVQFGSANEKAKITSTLGAVENNSSSVKLPTYTVATLPTTDTASLIYVSDEVGGGVMAFFDGTDWRRVTDRVIVS
jgi:hypothetical protein